jgi:tRNA(Ile)-lysidine synthase
LTKLERKLKAALRRFGLDQAPALLLAVSGGADSVSLSDALVRLAKRGKLPAKIFVAHLNHQLRGEESDGDEAFVRELAAQLQVECFVERVAIADAAKSEKQNLEATARRARYEFLARAAQMCGAGCVLTAHTRDDQAETVLMRLLRGSGAEGLRGIHAVRQLSESVTLIRPMLGVTRAEVIEHCGRYHLNFRTDSSNYLPDFTRNRVRQELLPLLRSFNPRTDEALSRTAELLTDDQDILHQLAVNVLTRAKQDAGLDAKQLREQSPAIRRRVLRLWLKEERGSLKRIEAVHLGAIEQMLLRNHGGKVVELPGNWKVRLKANYLTITIDQGETS